LPQRVLVDRSVFSLISLEWLGMPAVG